MDAELCTTWGDLKARLALLLGGAVESAASIDQPVTAAGPGITLGQLLNHMIAGHRRFRTSGSNGSALRCSAEDVAADGTPTQTLAELCAIWHMQAELLTTVVAQAPSPAVVELICEDVLHEHDLRMALSRPGDRDSAAVKVALDALSAGFSHRIINAGLTALRVTVEQWGTVAGKGPAYDCLVADRFELVRGLAGRRSASEMQRWNWSDEPTRYIAVLSSTGAPCATDLRERDPRVPEHMRDREFVL